MRLLSPFPLDHAHALPVTGEHHPLRREFHRWMSWGNAATMLLALVAICTYIGLQRKPAVPNIDLTPIQVRTKLKEPPSIVKDKVIPPLTHLVPPKVGILEPVPDTSPEVTTYPTAREFDKWIEGIDPAGKIPLDVIEVSTPPALPEPDAFVAVEQDPQFLRMDAPVYPPLARETGVEGTVLLRVLVSKEGKVLNVIVLSGNPMLAESARTAAFTAHFSPAMQQHKPVPVWVQLPVVFSLK